MILPSQIGLSAVALLKFEEEEELERQARIILARELEEGFFDSDLAEKTQSWLIGGDQSLIEGINLTHVHLRTILNRLDVQSVRALTTASSETAAPTSEETSSPQGTYINPTTNFFENVMTAVNFEILAHTAHRYAERDGESFIICDYDLLAEKPGSPNQYGMPRLTVHERYTSEETTILEFTGNSEGCIAYYENDDPNQRLAMVAKRWIESTWENDEQVDTPKMTLYIAEQPGAELLPARIEKYALDENDEWAQAPGVDAEGNPEEWPIFWTDNRTETGKSMPLPVVHFRNPEVMPGSKRIWGLQYAMDQMMSILLGGSSMSGYRMHVAFGWFPTTDGETPADDGSNLLKFGPGRFIGSGEKGPNEASHETTEAQDMRPILDVMATIAINAALVGGLPVANLVHSKNIAAADTLRQGETELVGYVHLLWALFGRSWKKVFHLCRVMETVFGSEKPDLAATIEIVWKPAETMALKERNEEIRAKSSYARVGTVQLWRDFGYTEQQINQMIAEIKNDPAPQLGASVLNAQTQTQETNTTEDDQQPQETN